MKNILRLYSTNSEKLNEFLNCFYEKKIKTNNDLVWEKTYQNPIEMSDIIASFIDNNYKYQMINMWVSIDPRCFY